MDGTLATLGLALTSGVVLALVPPVSRAADPDDSRIDEIVIVASKSERSIRDVAATVTVVSREDLDLELSLSLADMFRYTPGVQHEGGGSRFGTESVNIRGIGGNRVAVLLDGVPLSDQFDVGSFANATRDFVDAGFVNRVEILHGPASALYGSAAIGGVVALMSPQPADVAGTRGSGGGFRSGWRSADSSVYGTAMHAVSGRNAGLLVGIARRDGEQEESGVAEADLDLRQYRRDSGIAKLSAIDRAGNTWQVAWYGQDSRVLSSLNSMLGSGRFRSTTALEGNDGYRTDLLAAAYSFGSGGLADGGTLRAYAGRTRIGQQTLDERGLAARPVSIDRYFSFRQDFSGLEFNLQKTVAGSRLAHEIVAGAEIRERRTQEYRDGLETGLTDGIRTNVLLGEAFPLRDFPVSRSRDLSLFLEDVMSVGRVRIIAALRGDRYDLDPLRDAMYAEDYPFAKPVAISATDLSPKLGAVFSPTAHLDLYAQYAHGFRAPPYEDANIGLELPVFNYRAVPNPDLDSERSHGFDVGLRWVGQRGRANLSLFRTRYSDFIESKVRIGEDPVSGRILFQSRNLSRAVIEGIEVGWQAEIPAAPGELVLDAALYRAWGRNLESGQPLNSVGPAQAVLGADWTLPQGRWRLRLIATATQAWDDLDESAGELFKPSGATVADLFVARVLGERARLRVAVTNLTDRRFWQWSDVRGLAPGDPTIPYLARPGRAVAVGLEMDW